MADFNPGGSSGLFLAYNHAVRKSLIAASSGTSSGCTSLADDEGPKLTYLKIDSCLLSVVSFACGFALFVELTLCLFPAASRAAFAALVCSAEADAGSVFFFSAPA